MNKTPNRKPEALDSEQGKADDWDSMLFQSAYTTLMHIHELMEQGAYDKAKVGLKKLLDFETKTEQDEMFKALVILMEAILLWKASEDNRAGVLSLRIDDARDAVDFLVHEGTPLDKAYLKTVWDSAFLLAKKRAGIEQDKSLLAESLTWNEVFDQEYAVFSAKKEENGKG